MKCYTTLDDVRIIQFGEGNFLRAFIDWMVQGMQNRTGWKGSVLLAKTIPGPFFPAFEKQKGEYHIVIRGKDDTGIKNSREKISVLAGSVNPYEDFDDYLAAARLPSLQCIVSNTTEAGIAWVESDSPDDRPASSFPGKLTQLLRARFEAFSGSRESGLLILPCELIEKNGQTLREYVLRHAVRWYDDEAFTSWIRESCSFLDSLVDRIVPGYDPDERAKLKAETGTDDEIIVVTEPYHLLALQGTEREDILPLKRAGFNAVWTDDISPYRLRKVRILNGGHSFLAMTAPLLGITTVRDCIENPRVAEALRSLYRDEIIPILPFPAEEMEEYRETILNRFANPFVDHKLDSIALNSTAKWKTRLMTSLLDYESRFGRVAPLLALSLSALLVRYLDGTGIQDDPDVLAAFERARSSQAKPGELAAVLLDDISIWKEELPLSSAARKAAIEGFVALSEDGAEMVIDRIISQTSGVRA